MKKLCILLSIAILFSVISAVPTVSAQTLPSYSLGDVNGDGYHYDFQEINEEAQKELDDYYEPILKRYQ